ncbi:HD domain-containing protein [Rickettsia endosymbiont of Halotydeus destructor]|uniref:HD domain-containing protein n=1 Tax=Rickettsia endosymbiont of Halotydeus destructor TaxID=2996754 RepID=UPI003BB133DF
MQDINYWEEKFEDCCYSKRLLDKITYLNRLVKHQVDLREIKKGIYYARKYHGAQMRQSGEPYYSHPIEVAYMVAEFGAYEAPRLFTSTILNATLLHDTIEDTKLTEEEISNIFDKDIAKHVEGLTRIKPYGKISVEESINLLMKQKRHDTALIKIFDRVHNLQTLGVKSPEKIQKIIKETLEHFLYICAYFEIYTVEHTLVKLCREMFEQQANLKRMALKEKILKADNYLEVFQAIQNG